MNDQTNPFHFPLSTVIPKLSALIEELQKEQAEMLEKASVENPEASVIIHGVYGTVLSGLSSFTCCLSEGGRDPSMPKRVYEALEPLTKEVVKSHPEVIEDKVKSALNDVLHGKSH